MTTTEAPTAVDLARALLNVATLFAQHDIGVFGLDVYASYYGPDVTVTLVDDDTARAVALSLTEWEPRANRADFRRGRIGDIPVTLYLRGVSA